MASSTGLPRRMADEDSVVEARPVERQAVMRRIKVIAHPSMRRGMALVDPLLRTSLVGDEAALEAVADMARAAVVGREHRITCDARCCGAIRPVSPNLHATFNSRIIFDERMAFELGSL